MTSRRTPTSDAVVEMRQYLQRTLLIGRMTHSCGGDGMATSPGTLIPLERVSLRLEN